MNKKKKLLSIIVLLVCLLGGGLAWYFFQPSPPKEKLKEDTQAVGYDPKLKKPKNFSTKQVALPGFTQIVAKEGERSVDIALANPSFNNVYFKYIVLFDKTGEKLIETDLIAPGKAIKKMPIPEKISPGKYTLTIIIKTYDKKNKAELNGGSNKVPLVIEK